MANLLAKWKVFPAIGRLVVVGVAVALLAAAGVGVALASGAVSIPAYKQAQLAGEQASASAAALQSIGPKVPNTAIPSSCPDLSIQPGIIDSDVTHVGQFAHFPQKFTTGVTTLASDQELYLVLAGTPDTSDQSAGMLMVVSEEFDVCAKAAAGEAQHTGTAYYMDPARHGSLTLTSLKGDTVFFSESNGPGGAFDVVTGQFQ